MRNIASLFIPSILTVDATNTGAAVAHVLLNHTVLGDVAATVAPSVAADPDIVKTVTGVLAAALAAAIGGVIKELGVNAANAIKERRRRKRRSKPIKRLDQPVNGKESQIKEHEV